MFQLCPPHKYESRYDSQWPTGLEMKTSDVEIVKAVMEKTYVHDICIYCGDTKTAEMQIVTKRR